MSEKMTRIRLRNSKDSRTGFMDWGEHSFEDMVAQLRANAQGELEAAQAVLSAMVPDDFQVDIVRGPYVQKFIRRVDPER